MLSRLNTLWVFAHDKDDAQVSTGAFDRFGRSIHCIHLLRQNASIALVIQVWMGEDSRLAIMKEELSQRRCLADWSRG
jgi:hypothetical protein